ncbi:MAG: hypothetical protein ACI88C_001152, partial [Acidimicrobiales bacterium]
MVRNFEPFGCRGTKAAASSVRHVDADDDDEGSSTCSP